MYVDKIKKACQERNISIRDLAKEVGMSFSGLYASLNNNTLKVSALYDIAKVLDVPIESFLSKERDFQSVDISEFYSNRIVKLSANRYSKLSDKLNYLKDIFVGEVIWKLNNALIPSYPYIIQGKPKSLLNKHEEIQYILMISNKQFVTPFSKLPDYNQEYLSNYEFLFEGFYFPIFYLNLYSITDYLSDGIIQDKELNKYWESWQLVKDSIESLNWFIAIE